MSEQLDPIVPNAEDVQNDTPALLEALENINVCDLFRLSL